MPDNYGFLRFQIPGIALFVYWGVLLVPFISRDTLTGVSLQAEEIVAQLGAIFVLSMLLGYIVHQVVVNRHRQEDHVRPAHHALRRLVRQNSPTLLTAARGDHSREFRLIDALIPFVLAVGKTSRRILVDDNAVAHKIDTRWSHYYARKALFPYSLFAAGGLTLLCLAASLLPAGFPGQPIILVLENRFDLRLANFLLAGIVFTILAVGLARMNRYTPKLWLEICALEKSWVEAKHESIAGFLAAIRDPESWGAELISLREPPSEFLFLRRREQWRWE